MDDLIKVGMRVSLKWFDVDPAFDPRVPVSSKKHNPIIKHGVILAVESGLAVAKFDDGTVTLPTPVGCFTPLP